MTIVRALHSLQSIRATAVRLAGIAVFCLAGACAAPPTAVPIRAVYLVEGPAVLTASDLQAHPEISVVHSFDELMAKAHSKVAIWIDQNATPNSQQVWLNQEPQAYYPMVFLGTSDPRLAFGAMLGVCCFTGPIGSLGTGPIAPGFSVMQRSDPNSSSPHATFLQGYDQIPSANDILTITDALLDGTLPPTSAVTVIPRASPTPPVSTTDGVRTATPVAAGLTAQVELEAFSGRPNLTWPLSPVEIETFSQMVAALSTTSEQPYPTRLGYRAMIVSLPNAAGGDVVWRVWDHVAQM